MKISVKDVKGNSFDLHVEPTHTVMDVKKQLEQVIGDSFPCGQQQLIYNGNVLKDEISMDDNGVAENSFLHVMLTKAVESETKTGACPLDSMILSNARFENCSCLSGLRSIRGSSAFLRITEVFLVDEAAIDRLEAFSPFSEEPTLHKNASVEESVGRSHTKVELLVEEHSDLLEDMDLINEMVALGLPSSFYASSKEKHLTSKRKKGKSAKQRKCKLAQIREDIDMSFQQDEVSHENPSDSVIHTNSLFTLAELSQKDADFLNKTESNGISKLCDLSCQNSGNLFCEHIISTDRAMTSMKIDSLVDIKNASPVNGKREREISVEETDEVKARGVGQVQGFNKGLDEHSDIHLSCHLENSTELYRIGANSKIDANLEIDNSNSSFPLHVLEMFQPENFCLLNNEQGEEAKELTMGIWKPIWDTYYQRYYYYNTETWETSWNPPGMEHLNNPVSGIDATQKCVTGEQVIGGTSNKNYDGCSHSKSTDNEDIVDSKLYCPNYSEDCRDMEDVLNTHEADACTVLNVVEYGAESETFVVNGNCNQENFPIHNAFENRQDIKKELELTDMVLANSSLLQDIDVTSSKDTAQCLEESSDCCLSSGSSFSTPSDTSRDMIESSHTSSRACGTHIWFDDEGHIERKCTLQPEAIHTQESETYMDPLGEATFEDTSLSETFSVENIAPQSGQKEKKRTRLRRLSSIDKDGEPSKKILLPGTVEKMSISIAKYWCQRYQLFSKFDEGVKLDEEGWFSVTPEVIAKHHAARSGTGTVIDGFAGVGGNAIQFAQKFHHVVAIDIDPKKIDYAHHNAKLYGVADYIDFVVGDFFQLAPSLKADVVFLSPPWGGPDYLKAENYDIQEMLRPKDGFSLFKAAKMIAPNIVMFLPRNVDFNQLAELSWLSSPPLPLEVEKNYVNGKFKAVTVYFGDISLPITL